jgi:glucokinase
MTQIYLGIDFGGTNVKMGIFDEDMNLLSKTSAPAGVEMEPDDIVANIVKTAKSLIADSKHQLSDVLGIGIGTPGPADYIKGIVIKASNLPTFHNTPLRDMIADALGKPAVLENDANVACWGEFITGVGKDITDMIFFTLGTGIGGGIVSGGRLVQGCDGNGAELGHLIIYPDGRECGCGQKGCVEAYASASSTARRCEDQIGNNPGSSLVKVKEQNGEVTCKDVFEHAVAGDAFAKNIVDGTAKALAILCVNMLHTTEPQKIVFSGGMIAAGQILLDGIRDYFDRQIWKLKKETVEICFATLSEDTGIIGAAALAKYELAAKSNS